MSLKQKTNELLKRKAIAEAGGGEEASLKQQARGKMTARERIFALLDKDSFQEYDLFVQHDARDFDMQNKVLAGDGVITGTGTIYGQPVYMRKTLLLKEVLLALHTQEKLLKLWTTR